MATAPTAAMAAMSAPVKAMGAEAGAATGATVVAVTLPASGGGSVVRLRGRRPRDEQDGAHQSRRAQH